MSVSVRKAATVVLLAPTMDAMRPVKVCMLRRAQRASFFADAYVFPGGAVGKDDEEHSSDPFRFAALREVFEESGLLLNARGCNDRTMTPVPWDALAEQRRWRRAVLDSGAAAFDDLTRVKHVDLPALQQRLLPWAHWITPAYQTKRFDTRFYLAILDSFVDSIQQMSADGSETTDLQWMDPEDALTRRLLPPEQGGIYLAPPTTYVLMELVHVIRQFGSPSNFDSVIEAVTSSERSPYVTPYLPEPVDCDQTLPQGYELKRVCRLPGDTPHRRNRFVVAARSDQENTALPPWPVTFVQSDFFDAHDLA